MTRRAVFVLLVVAATVATASAASLGGLDGGSPSAGSSTVTPCDADGFTIDYTVESGVVTTVTISDIADPGCEGGDISVTLRNVSGASIGSGGPETVQADADGDPNTMSVAIAPQPGAALVAEVLIVATGP